jgi:hypothetical protein
MDECMKILLRDLGKKNIAILKEGSIIKNDHTGRILMEMNLNQGMLTDIKVMPEIRA